MHVSSSSTAAQNSSILCPLKPMRSVSNIRKRQYHQIMSWKLWALLGLEPIRKRRRQSCKRRKQLQRRRDEAAHDLKTWVSLRRSCFGSSKNYLKRHAKSRHNWSSNSGCRCNKFCSSSRWPHNSNYNNSSNNSSSNSNNNPCSYLPAPARLCWPVTLPHPACTQSRHRHHNHSSIYTSSHHNSHRPRSRRLELCLCHPSRKPATMKMMITLRRSCLRVVVTFDGLVLCVCVLKRFRPVWNCALTKLGRPSFNMLCGQTVIVLLNLLKRAKQWIDEYRAK